MIKRSFFLPLLFLLLMAISCQNDEDTIPTVILGTWEMVDLFVQIGELGYTAAR